MVVSDGRPEGKPKGSRSRPKKKEATEQLPAAPTSASQLPAPEAEKAVRSKGSASRGREAPKQDSQLKVPEKASSRLRAASADSNASYVSAVSQRGSSVPAPPVQRLQEPAAEPAVEEASQGYKQRRAMLLAQQRYRESMSYGRRRQSALARSGDNATFLSFAEYRKAMSYGARRAQDLAADSVA
ncbi:unnamed protein product [Cladocopium goreaui]|uniref:Uncharacterized protein n=1 Tax=Cladocopium goreaui TaxID=2562237 RepID=A0A9P1CN16_9DINO|nr:unnamed protein product [Cladocopium goreaui]